MNNKKLQNNEECLTYNIVSVGNRTDKDGVMSAKLKGYGCVQTNTPYEMEDAKGVSVKLSPAAITFEGYLPKEYLELQLPFQVRIPLKYAQSIVSSKTGVTCLDMGGAHADMLITPLVAK